MGSKIEKFVRVRGDLKRLESGFDESEYIIAAILNAFSWALLLMLLVISIFYIKGPLTSQIFIKSIIPSFITFLLLTLFFIYYPKILARKIDEEIEKELSYALRDMLVQINAGVFLFDAIRNISLSEYGYVSKEFERVVKDIDSGEAQERALEKMANRTNSQFLKEILWQIITVLRSGASLQLALKGMVQNLQRHRSAQIKSYSQEMNLWILLFIIIGVVLPSLGGTLIVILSSFWTEGGKEATFLTLIFGCFLCEIALIEFIRIRRPHIRV